MVTWRLSAGAADNLEKTSHWGFHGHVSNGQISQRSLCWLIHPERPSACDATSEFLTGRPGI